MLLLYSLAVTVVRWKNSLFLGIDACFKVKLKERGFRDPDLSSGLAYMVNEGPYQTYLSENGDFAEPVSLCHLFLSSQLIVALYSLPPVARISTQ